MKTLGAAAAELAGLFVEDRAFAVAIAIVIAVVAGLAVTHYVPPAFGGFVLFGGLSLELVASIVAAAKRA